MLKSKGFCSSLNFSRGPPCMVLWLHLFVVGKRERERERERERGASEAIGDFLISLVRVGA